MVNEEALWVVPDSPIHEINASSTQTTTPILHTSKLDVMLASLKMLTHNYPIKNAAVFLVETLLKEANIFPRPQTMHGEFEACGARGSDFCTLFIDAPHSIVDKLIQWMNHRFPALSAKSLNTLTEDEINTDDFTVISLTDSASITLHIDKLMEIIFPILRTHLIKDPHNTLAFNFIKALEVTTKFLQAEKENSNTSSLDGLINFLHELVAHIRAHGLKEEVVELKAQLQNTNNEQHQVLLCQLRASNEHGFFASLKKSSLQKISDTLTEILLNICAVTHIKILVNSAPELKK
jgi:hypothetical protein